MSKHIKLETIKALHMIHELAKDNPNVKLIEEMRQEVISYEKEVLDIVPEYAPNIENYPKKGKNLNKRRGKRKALNMLR